MGLVCQIQRRLFWDHVSSSEIQLPNFTPAKWFECDFFRVTKAGYFYEYEIKLTMSDFRADRKKGYQTYRPTYASWPKHLQLAARDARGPARFFYVAPKDLAERIALELPDWAGLLEFNNRFLRVVRQAPILHKQKLSRAVVRKALLSSYHRYSEVWTSRNSEPLVSAPIKVTA